MSISFYSALFCFLSFFSLSIICCSILYFILLCYIILYSTLICFFVVFYFYFLLNFILPKVYLLLTLFYSISGVQVSTGQREQWLPGLPVLLYMGYDHSRVCHESTYKVGLTIIASNWLVDWLIDCKWDMTIRLIDWLIGYGIWPLTISLLWAYLYTMLVHSIQHPFLTIEIEYGIGLMTILESVMS